MKIAIYTIALLFGSTLALDPEQKCRKKSAIPAKPHVRQALEPVNDLPENFNWQNKDGTNYLTNIKN